ncbi:MAG: universal stress protein, partial [Thermoanaerobaculia bacterium]
RAAAATALSAMTGREAWRENVRVSVEAVESDHVARTICATAERIGADLIIVGSRGHGAAPLVGSVARDVLAGSERPVLIVREKD